MTVRSSFRFRRVFATGLGLWVFLGIAFAALINTTAVDFEQPGTQPGGLVDRIQSVYVCAGCHGYYDENQEPFRRWAGSMMANATRDPVFHAALAIANQDVDFAGELCIRCHAPSGWLEGRSLPPDGSSLVGTDYEGVNCNFCHRLVDPIYQPGVSPAEDQAILAGLSSAPTDAHNGQYVVDPEDRRRGPFNLGPGFIWHEWLQSPFHRESMLCGTCHDVNNPAYTRVGADPQIPQAADTYVLNSLNTAHPQVDDKYQQFPIERTFSEWSQSAFASGPIDMNGRFGGNNRLVSTCQDCHMPDTTGTACAPGFGGETRNDLPLHDFNGANSWVPISIYHLDQSLALYGAGEINGQPLSVFQAAVDRNVDMLRRACDLEVSEAGEVINVRITNQTGHKLPTGYPEGRRMWINVQYFDAGNYLIQEHGAYDLGTATLTETNTKVYETKPGVDAAVAMATGVTEGPTFHFALNNKIYLDNRIPPRGFTNAAFERVQAKPVGYYYADGQYWDDTEFEVPCDAVSVTVKVYHQTTTREYIEFLRDENMTNNAGQIAYNEWVARGQSAPVEMASRTIQLTPRLTGDVDTITLSSGGTLTMCVNAGPANAGKQYLLLGSVSGTWPGLPLGLSGAVLPLNYDQWLLYSLGNVNVPPYGSSFGALDGQGKATATFTVPAGLSGYFNGLRFYHAYGVLTPLFAFEDFSNAVEVRLMR